MKRRFTEDSWRREPWFKALVHAFTSNRGEEQMTDFLRDIATLSELQAMSERFEVAQQLGRGLSYRQVSRLTGASTTTVTRIAGILENGTGALRRLLHVHRHQEVRRAMEKATKRGDRVEQNLSSPISVQPSVKVKSDEIAKSVSPLQKYLQKP